MSDDAEIERISRLLCRADNNDPDMSVIWLRQPYQTTRGHIAVRPEHLAPCWTLYSHMARAVVESER